MPAAPTTQGPIDFSQISFQPPAAPQTPNLLQAPQGQPTGLLDEASRQRLDGIVQQMQQNGETDSYIQNVVDDFKQKYAQSPTQAVAYQSGTVPSPLQVEGAKAAVQGSLYHLLQQSANAGGQIISGLNEAANSQNPQELFQGAENIGVGAGNAVQAPFSPILQPISEAINNHIIQPAANAISDLPQVQDFAQSKAGDVTSAAAEHVSNLANIASNVAAFGNPSQLSEETSSIASKATDTAVNAAQGAKDLVTPTLEQDVGKAFGFTGKMTSDTALTKTSQSVRALQTIVDNAPNITVTDANGIQVPFEPSKATFAETLDAFNQTKNAIYQQYSDLAANSGQMFTPEDFAKVEDTLNNVGKNSVGSFKAKAASLLKDLQENYAMVNPDTGEIEYQPTPLKDIQDFIQQVNTDVNPLSDKAGAQVSQALSQKLRSILDSKIEASTGKGYQALRNQYADLKSIENDLVNQFKKAARGQGGTIAKYVESFGSLDTIMGVLKGSPIEAAAGGGTFFIGKMMEYLKNPEAALQRAFQRLENSSRNIQANNAQPNISNNIRPTVTPQTPPSTPPTQEGYLSFLKNNMGDQRGFVFNPFGSGKLSRTQVAAVKSEIDAATKELNAAVRAKAPSARIRAIQTRIKGLRMKLR